GSGGCCSSSDILAYFGKPKGEIAVRWQALYEQPEVSKYYYAYDPNPGIKVPPKGPQHSKYMIFFSFGQLALKRETLTDEQLKLSTLSDLGYQLGTPNTFYFKVVSNSSLDSWSFSEMPLEEFQSIKGIEVTEEQYDYIIKHKYLDENAPNLTPEQLNYIKQQNSKKSLSYYLNKLLPEPTVFFEYH
ncbi:hypothetical protein KKA14_07040, partial [bacterium]|nr:hypothetical protein [bacterium]